MSKNTETETVVAAPSASIVQAPSFNAGFNAEDFHIPRLNCIHKMSEIEGNPGDLVMDRRVAIVPAGKKIPVNVVSIHKSWTEKVPYDGDIQPRIAYSLEQLEELRRETDREIVPRADITLLLPHIPEINGLDEEEASELFPFLLNEVPYQLVRLTVQSFAYDHTFKIINSFHVGNPDVKLHEQVWNLSAMLIERGKYSWYVPVLGRSINKSAEPVLAFINRLVTGGAA
jgi:hypothetical protein